jgi:DNA primase
MGMALSPQWLDELRARVTLSGVIMRTTKLQRAGREWKACCPFHNEKTPSFTVSDEKGFYHCFGCGAHGDVIRWMTDQRGLEFMDAVKELAAEAGMEVPRPDPREMERAERRASLGDVMTAAQEWFENNLLADEGKNAREYLKERGLDAATARKFGFGLAPDDRGALKRALGQFDDAMLAEAGLRIEVEDKAPYDRFRGRLMLPIHDVRGRIVAFAGRILDSAKTDAPKYLNSPDTPLFDKGRTLYNLHRAGPASRQSGRIVVVEGYMDVIALAAAGFEDTVAPMGTALTEQQIELLWRLVETPVLCFDGDAAGQRAAVRAATRALTLLRPGHSLSFATLPAGLDPDDLIRQQGRGAMELTLSEPLDLLEVLWRHERDSRPLRTPEEKAGLKVRLLEHVHAIQDADIRALYRRELLKRYSEFAFPARDWSGYANVRDIRSASRWKESPRLRINHPEILEEQKLSHAANPVERERHLQRRLGAAIAAGLLIYPEYVIPWAETLLRVRDIDPRLDAFIDASFEVDSLDTPQLEEILEKAGLQAPIPSEWDRMPFPFAWPPRSGKEAEEGLEQAMRLYVGLPQVLFALRQATEDLSRDFSDRAFNEQQRLRELASSMVRDRRPMEVAAA